MKYYMLVEIDITDPAWVAGYIRDVTPMVERFGGVYLSRTTKLELIEGDRSVPHVVGLVEWPSKAAATDFYHSEDYRPYREARMAGTRSSIMLIAAEDMNARS